MSSGGFNYRSTGGFNDSLIEIAKTLENIKGQRSSIEKEIENDEIYKDKLVEKLKSYQNELIRINGKFLFENNCLFYVYFFNLNFK